MIGHDIYMCDSVDPIAPIARPTALLCAKAYKIHDRLDPAELRRKSDRLRPKDYADMYRLLLAVSPEEAATVFGRGAADDRIGEAVTLGRAHLLEVLADSANAATMIADAWGDPSRESEFRATIDRWRRRFADESEG